MPPAYIKGPTAGILPSTQIPYWCAGKESFESGMLAAQVAGRHNGKGPRTTYYCRTCGSYHVGTDNGSEPAPKSIVAELVRRR